MSEDTDPTSFASILAGVQRMREQLGGGNEDGDNRKTQEQSIEQQPKQVTRESSEPKQVTRESIEPKQVSIEQSKQVTKENIEQQPKQKTPEESRPKNDNDNPLVQNKPAPNVIPTSTSSINPRSEPRARSSTPTITSRPTVRPVAPPEVLVHKSQVGNPLLKDSLMKTTSFKIDSTILSDYYINPKLQILFLSLKYHKLRPEYIWTRLKKLKGSIVDNSDDVLRILLVVVDIESHQDILRSLLNLCIKQGLALVLAWSFEEAGNYIHYAKNIDSNPHLLELNLGGLKPQQDYKSTITDVLTNVKSINKTDVSNLLGNYRSFKNIVLSNSESNEVLKIGGLGATKLQNLSDVFLEPFVYNKEYD